MTKNRVSYALLGLLLAAAICQGGFRPPMNYSVNPSPTSIVKGDFNGDGNLDLVVTGYGDNQCATTGAVIVLLGQGNGKFVKGDHLSPARQTQPLTLWPAATLTEMARLTWLS